MSDSRGPAPDQRTGRDATARLAAEQQREIDALREQTATTRRAVVPALEEFRPELILVSAGFDAHERDPLGQLRVTTSGFQQIVALLHDAAARLCEGRLALVTEGGYELGALQECLEATIRVLD